MNRYAAKLKQRIARHREFHVVKASSSMPTSLLLFTLLSWLLLSGSAFAARTLPEGPEYGHFVIGVYIDSVQDYTDVPMVRMFTDFLTHGIDFVMIGPRNYSFLTQNRDFNAYCRANGIQVIFELIPPDGMDQEFPEEKLRVYAQGQVAFIRSLPDNEVVTAYRMSDEIESWFWEQPQREARLAQAAANFRRLADLLRELDPSRKVAMNHCYMPGRNWLEMGEDIPMSSTGMTMIYNSYRIREQIAEAKKQGFRSYIVTQQAQTCPLGQPNLAWYGYQTPQVNDRVITQRGPGQTIQDQAEMAYTQGGLGVCYFLYYGGGWDAGYPDLSLVDFEGNDLEGKWEGVRRAALSIRNWEGAPACRVTWPRNGGWNALPLTLRVEASAPDPKDPVLTVVADYSTDGARSWQPLPAAAQAPFEVTLDREILHNPPVTVYVRVRAQNRVGWSLWDVARYRCWPKP